MPVYDVYVRFGMVFEANNEEEALERFLTELQRMVEEGELEEYVRVEVVRD